MQRARSYTVDVSEPLISSRADDDTEYCIDPDQVTVPESIDHREFTETLAHFAALALGPGWRVCRNLAWYPTPTDTALAPDLMVLPEAYLPDRTTSYRQAIVAGPTPSIVVEIVSEGNDLAGGLAKLRRFRNLHVPVILIDLERPYVDRFDASGLPTPCIDAHIAELGGIKIVEDADGLLVEGLDGRRARRIDQAAAGLAARVEAEAARADAATAEAERLAAMLRALGHDPSSR